MRKVLNIRVFSSFLLLLSSPTIDAQHNNDLRKYFFQQNKTEYTLYYKTGTDNDITQTKIVKIIGKDTIEVSDYGKEMSFIRSLTYVVDDSIIKIIKGRRSIDKKIFDCEIGNNIWARTKPKSSKKMQLDIRTEDTCENPASKCFWEWVRLKQTGVKKGQANFDGKKYKTITISFDVFTLYQPKIFSSIAALQKETQAYVFAEDLGLIKITTTIKKFNLSNTLTLIN